MWSRAAIVLIACFNLTGCVIVQTGVTNPMPEISTVAVVPFFNQSSERAISGQRVALAYASELQKIPGLEVIPVGVVEIKMRELGITQFANADDAIKLAEALNADAIVIGSITDYKPYYPPRIGMSVAWYSPKAVTPSQTMPIDPAARKRVKNVIEAQMKQQKQIEKQQKQIEKQQKEFNKQQRKQQQQNNSCRCQAQLPRRGNPPWLPASVIRAQSPEPQQMEYWPAPQPSPEIQPPNTQQLAPKQQFPSNQPPPFMPPEFAQAPATPIMSYTRIFDAADSELVAIWRDTLELTGDQRSADWEARLYWSDNFIRFAARLMIVEMFQLHGGEAKRRIVLKPRTHR